MAFIESPRFPEFISFGAVGGPGYSTDIVILNSGFESRNQNWSADRARWDVAHGVKGPTEMAALVAFFRAAKGRANAFRFKDWSDYQVTGSAGVLVALTASTWQMYKAYTSGSATENRKISKPVSGTVSISGGGSYTVDYTTGIITKSAGADPTGWAGEFDVPARFDTDQMRISAEAYNLYAWGQIPVVEVRV